jgi:pantoate kinase
VTAKTAQAFSPAGLSSFFEICDHTVVGTQIVDLENVGARGGGFGLQKGILTKVTVSKTKTNKIDVSINGKPAPEAETSISTIRMLLENTQETYNVTVDHKIEVPIGAGFGTSAAGALTAGLALKETLELPLTLNQIGKVAHAAEIQCKTGLGTVGPLMLGGCILTLEPGAPGVSIIDRIPLTPNYVIVTGVFGPTPTKQILSSTEKRREINRFGKKTLSNILVDPSLETFLSCCWQFAQDTGFATERVRQLVQLAEKAGAIGAAQNMVGEAVHAVTLEENALELEQAFKQMLPKAGILVSKIDFQGARLVTGNEKL